MKFIPLLVLSLAYFVSSSCLAFDKAAFRSPCDWDHTIVRVVMMACSLLRWARHIPWEWTTGWLNSRVEES